MIDSLNFLIAISTFYSIAQLTCAITHCKIYNEHLHMFFYKWLVVVSILVLGFLWDFYGLEIKTLVIKLIPFFMFLLFTHIFCGTLAEKLKNQRESTRD